ncbi:uncharacterized protein LOC119391608 [Rhipicephalus sanguineus]|uniref:uncharacterized protein LOC119391608 n=1 Tax=Rhipicephalus sanguineus TaxID=34632 RepID=UPI0020C58B28|nr:uncharacterized protein LOC119391608 [Rhipicephalus sanguineus]
MPLFYQVSRVLHSFTPILPLLLQRRENHFDVVARIHSENLLYFEPINSDLGSFEFTVAYRDCKKCKVFRHNYINNGTGCSFWLTDEALNGNDTCCEFVYALLGGPDKYMIYDDSCK